jgi:hypothetical protein
VRAGIALGAVSLLVASLAVAQSGSRGDAGAASADREAEWVRVPAGWRPLAELAAAPGGEPRKDVRVESRSAYGDPASGCFAVLQRLSVPARGFDAGHARQAVMRQLQAVEYTAGPMAEELPFVGHGVQGRMRMATEAAAEDRIAVLSAACFYNDREPERCRPMCDAMLDSAGARR